MEGRSNEEMHDLRDLLKRKLLGIPGGHLPSLTLTDIIDQTPKATSFSNIPPDLQLDFLLTNRALVDSYGCIAIKDETKQSINITRAIFFYRLDEAHQFQRYHDAHRWNVAIFIALLTLPRDSRTRIEFYKTDFPPAARRFAIAYLDAVLEHHSTPEIFERREAFVRLWKGSAYDFFTFSAAQKKLLKTQMKRLTAEWEKELDRAMDQMGEGEYVTRVASFVGVLMPGRKDQRALQGQAALSGCNSVIRDCTNVPCSEGIQAGGSTCDAVSGMSGPQQADDETVNKLMAGTLLKALQVPNTTESGEKHVDTETRTVTRIRDAIDAVQKCVPRTMLHMLMELFPPEDNPQDSSVKRKNSAARWPERTKSCDQLSDIDSFNIHFQTCVASTGYK